MSFVKMEMVPARYKVIQKIATIDRQVVAEVTCRDYDEYKALPETIDVGGRILGKTGWSSDTEYACYKSDVLLGKIL